MIIFEDIDGIPAPMPIQNIDTDKILPGQFLKTISRDGLGKYLFWTLRADPEFVLNKSPWNKAKIIVALENFGCGSSREHAPWALLDFGVRCIISPQIADIFYKNCIKNKILPIVLPRAQVLHLMSLAGEPETSRMSINLESQEIKDAAGEVYRFDIDQVNKNELLSDRDEISKTLEQDSEISVFEKYQVSARPWIADTRRSINS